MEIFAVDVRAVLREASWQVAENYRTLVNYCTRLIFVVQQEIARSKSHPLSTGPTTRDNIDSRHATPALSSVRYSTLDVSGITCSFSKVTLFQCVTPLSASKSAMEASPGTYSSVGYPHHRKSK